jgi:hypothetical protein
MPDYFYIRRTLGQRYDGKVGDEMRGKRRFVHSSLCVDPVDFHAWLGPEPAVSACLAVCLDRRAHRQQLPEPSGFGTREI